ncbi:LamG domain-containing protein [Belliella pelovolcani]|nr:LamG-like jellyroll fold domain-containing protein [Belliella pelovolcani]
MVNIESMDNGDGTQTLFLCIDSAPTFFLASEFDAIDPPFTVMIDGICEIPGVGRRNEVFYINQGTDINQYERGFDVSMELRGLPNENELFIEFYQPNVFVGSLSSGNNHFYTSIIMVISDLKLVRNDRIDLSEIKIQGITDRNIFNYNLNRNRDYFYQDIEETDYKYTLVDSDGFALPEKSFIRKSKNNLTINNEELNVPELNLKQNLEQYKFQQKKITGELFVKNQFDFDILNSLKIDNKDFSIQKFILNDYDSVYDVELVEIKDVKIDEGFDIININITDANTSNYILIDSEDLFEPFQPTNREFAYYELNRNTSDSFENFANGENIGEFTFNTELEGVRLASFNGVNQYFQTDEELTSRGLIGTNGNNSNSIGVWLGFEEIPTTDKFIWIASNSNQSTFTGLKFNASNQKLEYIRFNQGSTNFNINNVIDEFTLVYNGAVAQEGDQFIYDGNTYDIVGVEPNVIYFLPALVGYTGDATPFIETQFQLIQNPVNSVVESQLTIEEGVLYTSFCRYNNQTGIQELFINNELQGSITNINSLSISQSDLTRVRLGNSEIEGFTKMNAGRFRIAGIFLDDDEIGRLGTKAIFNVNLRNLETGEILQIPQDWFVIVNNNQIGFNIPPEFQLGTFLLWISAGGIESPKLVFNIRPIQFRTSPMEVRFDNEDSLNQHFEALNKGWGGANGGVVASNCYIGDDGNGTTALVLESHGDLYTGSVQGVDNFGRPKFKQDGTPWTLRKGGCVISKEYLGFGSYEAEARVIPQLGVCSAFWNFHYQEIYPTDPRWEDYQKDVIDTSMMQPNLRSQFLFENNVNSISGIDTPTWTITDPSNTSYTTGVKGGSAIRYNGNTGWAFNITGVQTLGSFSNSYTVSLWVKINVRASVNQRHTIISNGTANNGAWGVQVFYGVNPEFQLVGKASGGTVVGTNNPNQKPYETWQHLVMVNNPTNNTMLLYIDGVLTQTVNAPSGTYNDVGWWRIIQTAALSGGGAGASVRDIEVADVRLINRAVDQLEARVMYGRPNFVGNPDFEGLGLRPIGNDEDGYYAVRNNEIDIEVPSQLEGGIIDEPSILNAKFNTWRGEYQNWDVDKNHPDYWEEYRDNYRPMGIDVTDGLYHKFRYDWYHDRVEFYIDDVLIITNYNYQFGLDSYNIPDVIGKYTMGNWFPSGARRWAGKNANFDIEKMYVKSFKYVPFNDEINNHQVIVGETYPRDGIVDLSGDSSVVRN